MKKQTKKEKYVKPELKAIQLHAKEVLALGCKTTFTGANVELGSCGVGTCFETGS